jgi:hypothetical protein
MAHLNGKLTISRVILFGTPLLWIVLALIHPHEPDEADRWVFVHFSQLALTPFLAFAAWMLLDFALRKSGARPALVVTLGLSALFAFHASYPAAIGLASFLVTAGLWVREKTPHETMASSPVQTA